VAPAAPTRAASSTNGEPGASALDPARLLADADACSALAELASRLRAVGYDGTREGAAADRSAAGPSASTLVAVAQGDLVRAADLRDGLGVDVVGALDRAGALRWVDGQVGLGARVFPMRSLLTLLPHHTPGRDIVYLGPDSVCLFDRVWAARGFGDRAADLATGNGFIAAALATRYDHVVATDLSTRCVATAALVPVLNPHLRERFSAVQADVAAGLRAGSFDLVTANAPWVPETVGPDGGPPRRFAAGGPSGFELPRRFLDGVAALLAPRGRAFVACLDMSFDDGRRPLVEHLTRLRTRGYETSVVESPMNEVFDYGRWAAAKAPGATRARHVVVELRRSDRS